MQWHGERSFIMKENYFLVQEDDVRYTLNLIGKSKIIQEEHELRTAGEDIVNMFRQILLVKDLIERKETYYRCLEILIASLIDADAEGKENLKRIFILCNIFKKLYCCCKVSGNDDFYISDKYARNILIHLHKEKDVFRAGILCAMFDLFSENIQAIIFQDIKDYTAALSYHEIVLGINNGAIHYGELAYSIFCERIRSMNVMELDKADYFNPVYEIVYLYIYGMMDIYSLREYEKFCYKSDVLRFCMYPDYTEWPENIMKNWKHLLFRKREFSRLLKSRRYDFGMQ